MSSAIDEMMKDGPFTRSVIKPTTKPKTAATKPAIKAVIKGEIP